MGDRACFPVRSVGGRILKKVVEPLSRLRSGLAGTLVIFLSPFLLTACILTADQSVEGNPKDPRAQDIVDRVRSIDLMPRQSADAGTASADRAATTTTHLRSGLRIASPLWVGKHGSLSPRR